MSTPEEITAQESGNQDSTESTEQTTVTEEQTATSESSSYYDSEESLKSKINELTTIAETGDSEAVSAAMNELSEIESTLERMKANPHEKPVKEPEVQPTEKEEKTPEEKVEEAKKFTVHWQGEKVEREDLNNLLGYKTTGDLKAAFIKQELASKSREQDLLKRLEEANEKLVKPPAAPQSPPAPRPQQVPQPPVKKIDRPVPPAPPVLSTQDPTLYTEEDIGKLDAHQKATSEFNQKMIDYVESVRSQPPQVDPSVKRDIDEIKKWREEAGRLFDDVKKQKQDLENERIETAHWKRFSDFMDKHDSFKTPLPPRQMNDKMQGWMDSIAMANGIKPANGHRDDEYMYHRADVVSKFLGNDPQVVQNAQGIAPPEGREAYFKMLELNNALGKYVDSGVFGKNATLEDAYLRMKADSGEMETDIDAMRTQERTKATQQFAEGVEELQQHAAGVDPSASSGGPDMTSLGFPKEDLVWFQSVTQQKLADMQTKSPDLFKKWNLIADAIEKKLAR